MMKTKGFRPIWWGIIILLWAGFIILNWVLFIYGDTDAFGRYDFLAYAKGAQALVDGLSPYRPSFDGRHLYLYPPLLAQLLMPFMGTIGELNTAILWYFVNIACLIGTIQLMCRYTAPQHHIWLWLFPILFTPFIHTLDLGQVTVIMLYMLTLIWHDYRNGKKTRAGLWLAFICWIKVYPAILVIYFLLRRDWRVMYGVIMAGVGLGIAQILISGLDIMLESFQVLLTLFNEGQTGGLFKNSSITGMTARMFTDHPIIIPIVVDNTLFTISRYGLLGITLLLTYGMAWHYGQDDNKNFDLGFGATLLMALMTAYTFWISGMPPYLLIFWLVFRHSKGISTWVVMACFITLCLYFPLLVNTDNTRLPWWSIYSLGFYASYTLWGVMIYKLARK